MSTIRRKWKEKNDITVKTDDVLNGLNYEECSDIQQMLYHIFKRLEVIEERLKGK